MPYSPLFAENSSSEYFAATFPPRKNTNHIASLSNTLKYRTGASVAREMRRTASYVRSESVSEKSFTQVNHPAENERKESSASSGAAVPKT